MKILFVHGWACGPELWNPIIGELQELTETYQIEITCLDFGFYGAPEIPTGHFDLVVCHSFGLLWILNQQQITFGRLVAINGFTRFFADQELEQGTPVRILDRMYKKIQRAPEVVLADFFALCGANQLADRFPDCSWLQLTESNGIDLDQLSWGLDGLKKWDHRTQWSHLQLGNAALRVLASMDDRVVSPQLTENCFENYSIDWFESDCHLLPLAAPKVCINTILKVITSP